MASHRSAWCPLEDHGPDSPLVLRVPVIDDGLPSHADGLTFLRLLQVVELGAIQCKDVLARDFLVVAVEADGEGVTDYRVCEFDFFAAIPPLD